VPRIGGRWERPALPAHGAPLNATEPGGLRGGISVALVLSLPEVAEKSVILAATYAVVLFTIIIQGLSLRALVARVVK
jgi:NhaP-type Na+/H+ or K+/H+ antiporter